MLSTYLPPERRNMANWLSEVLGIDQSNAYRRIRGEKELGIGELHLMTQNLPQLPSLLEKLWRVENRTSVDFYSNQGWGMLQSYLRRLIKSMTETKKTRQTFCYNSREASFFLMTSHARLAQVYFNSGGYIKFGSKAKSPVPLPVLRLCQEIQKVYQNTHSVEVWHYQGLVNFVVRLKFLLATQQITSHELMAICEVFKLKIIQYHGMVAQCQKQGGAEISIHVAEYPVLNEAMIFDQQFQCFLGTIQESSVLVSDVEANWRLIKRQWQHQLAVSQSISATNTRGRSKFFGDMIAELEDLLTDQQNL